ncbi:hypothetical protein C8Q72DRAFT_837734, partial [Fomitopsis betulina]
MARGGTKLSKAQRARNREATARSLASRARKNAAAPSANPSGSAADSIEKLRQDRADAACKLSAAKAESQRSKAAAKLATTAAKRDKYNAEHRIRRLKTKLAERELNTTVVPTSYPSTTFIPSSFPAIASTSTPGTSTAAESDTTFTMLLRVPAVTTPATCVGQFAEGAEEASPPELRGQLRERLLKHIFPYKTKEGDFDRHSISRIVREGYVAAAMHVMWEVSEADSWTGSADGTGHKHIEHLSHHMYTTKVSKDPLSGSVASSHTLLNLGVRAVPGKTSE